jgi:2,3-bisphosphoglycerate-independent phosphoglycerate mutase
MVGHTGNLQAAITAVETVDTQVGRIVASLDKVGGLMLLTADHGNAEVMEDPITHAPHTAHTTNLVPFLITDSHYSAKDGKLSDIAPTILDLLQIKIPTVMSRCVLIQKKEK